MLSEALNLRNQFRDKIKIYHPYHTLYFLWIPCFLALCYILIVGKEHLGKPIVCSATSVFDKEYVEARCWGFGTYTLTHQEKHHISLGVGQLTPSKKSFSQGFYKYTWLTVFGLFVLFLLPSRVWKWLESKRTSTLCQGLLPEDRPDKDEYARGKAVFRCVRLLTEKERLTSSYLAKYFTCMFWSLMNPLISIFVIDASMNYKFLFLGFEMFKRSSPEINGYEQAFPLEAKCDVASYGPGGGPQVFDAICQLPINTINRAVFPMIWFGLVLLGVCGIFFFIAELIANLNSRLAAHARIPRCMTDKENILIALQKCRPATLFLMKQVERNVDPKVYQELFDLLLEILPYSGKFEIIDYQP